MRALIEVPAFLALAFGLHLAVLSHAPQDGGEAAGSGGTEIVTITGTPAMIEEIIEEWTRPPDSQTQTDTLTQPEPEIPQAVAEPIHLDIVAAPRAGVQLGGLHVPQAEDKIVVDTQTATPTPSPPKPEPETPLPEPVPEKAKKAPVTKPAVMAQKAAGKGGSKQAGTARSAKVKTASAGQQASLERQWGAAIRRAVVRQKRYPKGGRGKATVGVQLRVSRSGALMSSSVSGSSGQPLFDRAALAAVRRVGRFPKAPKGLAGEGHTFSFRVVFGK